MEETDSEMKEVSDRKQSQQEQSEYKCFVRHTKYNQFIIALLLIYLLIRDGNILCQSNSVFIKILTLLFYCKS